MVKRTDKLDSLFQEEISRCLVKEFAARGFDVLVTVTAVRVSKDLVNANVYYSMMGDISKEDAQKLVLSVRGNIVAVLRKRLHIKRIPSFNFVFDDTPAQAANVELAFRKIDAEQDNYKQPDSDETV